MNSAPIEEALRSMASGMRSVTTDLGVEVKLADWQVSEFRSLLPQWLDIPALAADTVEDEDCGQTTVDVAQKHFLLPSAMPVAGACHLLHAVSESTFENLSYWETFYAGLELLDELLMLHRGKLIATCCKQHGDKKVIQGIEMRRLYKKRWHFVVLFINAISPALPVLRRVWDLSVFGATDSTAINLKEVRPLLDSRLFTKYLTMVSFVHALPKQVSGWLESCSCHDFEDVSVRKRMIKNELGRDTCPMAGRRSSELATGKLQNWLQEWNHSGVQMLHDPELNAADRDTLMVDYYTASERVVAMIKIKFGFWGQLPWKICGMHHWDLDAARSAARECLQLYDEAGPPIVHHRVSVNLLDAHGPLRIHVEAFASTGIMHETLVQE
eukprot:6472408-Amphidinium_carterae.2